MKKNLFPVNEKIVQPKQALSRRAFTKAAIMAPIAGTLAAGSLLASPLSASAQTSITTQSKRDGRQRIDLFVRGGELAVWHRFYENGSWSGWDRLGGQVIDNAPVVTSWGPGRLDVFGTLNGELRHVWYDNGQWSSQGEMQWENLGTPSVPTDDGFDIWDLLPPGGFQSPAVYPLTSAPAVCSSRPGCLTVLGISGNNLLAKEFFPDPLPIFGFPGPSRWHDWKVVASVSAIGDPAIVSWGPGHADVFVRSGDNQLYIKTFDQGNQTYWSPLGGILTSSPSALSVAPGRWDVFVRNTDNLLSFRRRYVDGSIGDWFNLDSATMPTPATSAPGVVSWGLGRWDLFTIDQSHSIQHLINTSGGHWSHDSLGGYCTSAVAATSW